MVLLNISLIYITPKVKFKTKVNKKIGSTENENKYRADEL